MYGAALLDIRDGRTIRDAAVIVSGDRIVSAGPRADARVPGSAARVELGNVTLLPGFIDADVHLAMAGLPTANARAALEAGFTTVQDLGAADAQVLALRNDISAGRVAGPRVLASERWIGVRDGRATSMASA